MNRLRAAVGFACWSVLAASAASAELSGRWTATSTASMAITGDIALNGDVLTFGNGLALRLTPVATKPGRWTPLGTVTAGAIYELNPPSDPVLLNGTTLCGMPELVRYIVLTEHARGSLALSVFTTATPPQGFGDRSCAAYFYER